MRDANDGGKLCRQGAGVTQATERGQPRRRREDFVLTRSPRATSSGGDVTILAAMGRPHNPCFRIVSARTTTVTTAVSYTKTWAGSRR